ncbi:MAG: hypothetical protein ACUVTL_06975 [Thermoproteota archaeon]
MLDVDQVVEDFIKNKGLWKGVVMDSKTDNSSINLIKLRDVEEAFGTLILPEEGKEL